MARVFFGERWDAPVVDDAEQVPTPVGQSCMWCGQPIAEGDRGMMTAVMRGDSEATVEPGHLECELPAYFGGPDHVRGRCTATGGCMAGWEDRRALGLATLDALNEQRAARGQGPL